MESSCKINGLNGMGGEVQLLICCSHRRAFPIASVSSGVAGFEEDSRSALAAGGSWLPLYKFLGSQPRRRRPWQQAVVTTKRLL